MRRLLSLLIALPTVAATLDSRVHDAIAAFKGTVYLYAKNLDTGQTYGILENERVRTASTIKLPIMAALFAEVAAGHVKWTDELVLHECPALPERRQPLRVDRHARVLHVRGRFHVLPTEKRPGQVYLRQHTRQQLCQRSYVCFTIL